MTNKKRVLSGIQPTGKLHLGNLIGAIENWVKLQDQYECYFFLADLHALSSSYENTKNIKNAVKEAACDLLAAGLDPNKCVLFRQSDLPQHSELHLLFSMITPLSWLERVPTYKSKIEEMKEKDLGTYGFLGYPILQAADILMYKADYVPVGQDQLPHIELTREIGRRFNNLYGNVFTEPKELLTEFPVLPGIDGRKMSKSYNNTIAISDPVDVVNKKILAMVTDPARVKRSDKGHPKVCPVFAFYQVFGKPQMEIVAKGCESAERGCVECKKELASIVVNYLAPIQQRGLEIKNIEEILAQGKEKALIMAEKTLAQARQAIGLI